MKFMKLKFFTYVYLILCSTIFSKIPDNNTSSHANPNNKKLDVFIFCHGTVGAAAVCHAPIKALTNRFDKSQAHSNYPTKIRNLKVSRQKLMLSPLGLHEINPDLNSQKIKQSWEEFANGVFQVNEVNNSNQMICFFGWSGQLSQKGRLEAAEKFYHELLNKETELKKKGLEPTFHIVAHSHGGNVSLLLAKEHEKRLNNNFNSLSSPIETLVLLSTPIQKETSNLAHSALFKKIINLYSTGDPIQTADFFSTKGPSKRTFDLPSQSKNKIIQAKVLYITQNGTAIKPDHLLMYLPSYSRKNIAPVSLFVPEIIKMFSQVCCEFNPNFTLKICFNGLSKDPILKLYSSLNSKYFPAIRTSFNFNKIKRMNDAMRQSDAKLTKQSKLDQARLFYYNKFLLS